MPQPNPSAATVPPEVNPPAVIPEVPASAYVREIAPQTYKGREYYAARDACHARDGILRGLRAALNGANGRAVEVTIRFK